MAELDTEQLELLTPHVTTQLQVFNNQVVAHLKNYKPEIARIYGRLDEQKAEDERLGGQLKGLEATVAGNAESAAAAATALSERLAKVEALLGALPAWKEDLVTRINALGHETRAKHEAATARANSMEETLNGHIAATRERLDMLTTLARTASEARAAQQERIDELDGGLRRLRDATEKELTEHRVHLRRLDEQYVLASSKLAEHSATLGGHTLDLARLRDAADQHGRQLDSLARGAERLTETALGLSQEVELVKRGVSATDAACSALEMRLGSVSNEMGGRISGLEAARKALFGWRDETIANLERMDTRHDTLNDRVQCDPRPVKSYPTES
ncbi:hypothetical protein GPECTOR_64g117 [Gonium pectorale]|uniref:Uncharacterized protein n=1 Tax=Gonium pectorale TaxID=33097 RepID=A0A150G4B5_GONPE|nr:hypothetical protein GPECTOR_64g117 [Gonium pectorale]|eukprot:KXZ44623.1 hypothetical protein GPECTOR_64g117 [Gonium pectorale]